MHQALVPLRADLPAVPIHFVEPSGLEALLSGLLPSQRRWAQANGFEAAAGQVLLCPDGEGAAGSVLFGLGAADSAARNAFLPGKLATSLPPGTYRFATPPDEPALAALAFLLSLYRFDRYRKATARELRLIVPEGVDGAELSRIAEGVRLARDLVNTPANDMGPEALEDAARRLAERHGASFEVIRGESLLEANLPMIHAVGRASASAPRLIDMSWGREDAPKVTLVGKGVCFDTGGLDIKPSSAMLLMKKDMGGAANVLGLAAMVMDAGLDLRLRVLIPAVENAISANAFRPGDILASRKGITVEIGNTDAEGRLVLADALTLADEEAPELLIDLATLTGAARVALGPELPPFYVHDDATAREIEDASRATFDPVWRLPLWPGYRAMLDSKVAEMSNTGTGGFAGSITAALFLDRFVEKAGAHVHFDIYAWSPAAKPGRTEGGEAQAIRALYHLLRQRYPG